MAHGNWCGPDWTGGQIGTWSSVNQGAALPPEDDLDSGCEVHDKCYEAVRRRCKKDPLCEAAGFNKCDTGLRNHAWNLPSKPKDWTNPPKSPFTAGIKRCVFIPIFTIQPLIRGDGGIGLGTDPWGIY